MTKIGVISFLHNDNFGSSLQAYAIQYLLRKWGYDCEHIDYQPDTGEKIRNLLTSGNNPKLILEGMRKRQVKFEQSGARKKSASIPVFYQDRMKLSPCCPNRKALKRQIRKYDVLICGSDQIWNPTWLNAAYFLPFSGKNQRKIAYAASLGVRVLPSKRKIRKIRKWTKDFAAISVRENEGAGLMEQMTGIQPAVMPDPVVLLSCEEWKETAETVSAGKPYLLCYFIGEKPEYWETAEKISRNHGLDIRVVPVTAASYEHGYELLDGMGPGGFLGALLSADAVCTDSFHCVAFSEIFGKPFTVCRRDRDEDPESRNSRIDSFLKECQRRGIEELGETGRNWLKAQVMRPDEKE